MQINYQDYIKSDEWAARRRKYYATHKRECRACGSKKNLNLHHKTYARLGNEKDIDLVVLCRTCHNSLHILIRKEKSNIWSTTELFIRNRKKFKNKTPLTVKRVPKTTNKKNGKKRYERRRNS